jgi:succinoglycan biosynthesis protein ExoM
LVDISIVICTLHRPRHLEAALRTCFDLLPLNGQEVEIVVVDNGVEAAVADLVLRHAANAPMPLRYVPEPRTNIAHARNTGIAASRGSLIAFIDDDMRLSSGWLRHVVRTMAATSADVLIGAIEPRPEAPDQICDPHALAAHRRDFHLPDGACITPNREGHLVGAGTGNSVLRRARCITGAESFDPAFGRSGGEDTDFLQRLGQRGVKVVWSAHGLAYEIVSSQRATVDYVLLSAFRGSQNYARAMIKNSHGRLRTIAKLTGIGAAQAMVWLTCYGLFRLVRPASALEARLAAARALGKVLWMSNRGTWWEVPRQ